MADIPTELLRSLIAVVDCRSYTKAAQRLGLTQSTVSTQIKRLQEVVGCTLFDKSAPGVRLTENGERVVASGRRILSINDECISHISPEPSEPTLRIGIPSHFIGAMLSPAICQIRGHSHRIRLHIQSDISDKLLIVFTGNSIVSLTTAVAAGVGVTVVTRRAAPPHLVD
jgi:DNA-binding transcriptional LysR family regulator